MTAQIRGLNMATKNANDGLSMLGVIENATNDVTDMLHRMRELAIQATNDTNGTEDRAFLQKEVAELIKEIDRVATQTQYNGQTVLDGTFSSKSIQVGTESGQKITFSVNGIKTDAIGTAADASASPAVVESDVADINISTAAGAQSGLQVITDAIEQVAGDRATYGALQNRLEYTVSNLMNVAEFTTAARSRIEDADFAAESARLAKAQVLQQTGTAMLAQANASSQLALSLIR
jgi:flagellin